MNNFKLLSIVVPVYNEEKFIEETIKQILVADTFTLKKEIIVVDDASKDKTPSILKGLILKHKNLKVVFKKKNEGKGSVLKTGFSKTTGDIVLIQDADLEYSPSDYPSLIEPFLKSDADVVYGSRLSTTKPHRVLYFWHYIVNKSLTMFSNMLTNLNLTDMETGYKVFRGDIIRKITPTLESKRFGFEPEITARIAKISSLRLFEVGISYSGRTYKDGKKIGWKDGLKAIWEIIKYNLLTS
jgi:glycosyltransferase involved in cell wall biosynthesis